MKIRTFILITIAIIGVIGECCIFSHNLMDCYPYKIMSYPSGIFFERLAFYGLILIPIPCLAIAFIISRKTLIWFPLVSTAICPVLYVLLFVGAYIIGHININYSGNFDSTTPANVQNEFILTSAKVALAATFIGTFVGYLVKRLFRTRAQKPD